jgi:hypothetical protein
MIGVGFDPRPPYSTNTRSIIMPRFDCGSPENANAVAKRAFFLAFTAARGPSWLGFLQDRGPGVSEDEVWANVLGRGDYQGGALPRQERGEFYGDYVFGRMLKLRIAVDNATGTVSVYDGNPDIDYQAWCGRGGYPSYAALVEAAAGSLGFEIKHAS